MSFIGGVIYPIGTVPTLQKTTIINVAQKIAVELGYDWDGRLEKILSFCIDHPALLNKREKIENASSPHALAPHLTKYVREYYIERDRKIELNAVLTTSDDALDIVLQSFAGYANSDLKRVSMHHRVSMAAENILGELLERYVASVLEPSGWIWCCGKTMRAVDFYRPGSKPTLLQVKNRDNSENSSSSAIRAFLAEGGSGTIEKWHRVRSRDGKTCWDNLPGNKGLTIADEEHFNNFIRNQAALQR